MLTVVIMRVSITFAAGQISEIGRYEVPREEFLPGFWMDMTIDNFQMARIRYGVTESLKRAVRYSIALGPRFYVKDTELIRSKGSCVAEVTYSFSNLVRCECHR